MEEVSEPPLPVWKSNRRILIVAGPRNIAESSLAPHEILYAKHLESALEVISASRPDLVIYFTKGKNDSLEEHVMTWLIEGFRGKFLLFDPSNRVKDFNTLLQSQVVDEYLSGPVGPTRFISIIKSQLTQDIRFAAPRAMTTFDLFRNLFDRGLNAIFFFNEDLSRCVAANLRAEQITGHTLYELRRLGLRDLCTDQEFDPTLRTIRRAGRHYYDAKGTTSLRDRRQRPMRVAFSCGVFNFGRRSFVKVEVQGNSTLAQETFFKALDRGMAGTLGQNGSLSMIVCKVKAVLSSVDASDEEAGILDKVSRTLEENIRQSDTMSRLGHYQFAILLPKTPVEKAERLVERLRFRMDAFPEVKEGLYTIEIGTANCPPDAYPFMHLLRSTDSPGNGIHSPHH